MGCAREVYEVGKVRPGRGRSEVNKLIKEKRETSGCLTQNTCEINKEEYRRGQMQRNRDIRERITKKRMKNVERG